MSDFGECSCTKDTDCDRCKTLERAGDEWLEYNDSIQIGMLLEESEQLKQKIRCVQERLKPESLRPLVMGGMRTQIHAHGPITTYHLESAWKRIYGQLKPIIREVES